MASGLNFHAKSGAKDPKCSFGRRSLATPIFLFAINEAVDLFPIWYGGIRTCELEFGAKDPTFRLGRRSLATPIFLFAINETVDLFPIWYGGTCRVYGELLIVEIKLEASRHSSGRLQPRLELKRRLLRKADKTSRGGKICVWTPQGGTSQPEDSGGHGVVTVRSTFVLSTEELLKTDTKVRGGGFRAQRYEEQQFEDQARLAFRSPTPPSPPVHPTSPAAQGTDCESFGFLC
uniref:Uncharacterized protein n=1 Tax=Branchiostoma floridae TaxID=7739 RepID=C3YPR9_BRAFL|eukprot:XP_002601841.1 hypothetical protein BRAFLDRAFT_75942 [Branchiostoma floridae]